MEIPKVVKAFLIRGWPNTFGNIVYVKIKTKCVLGFHDTKYCSFKSQKLSNKTNKSWQLTSATMSTPYSINLVIASWKTWYNVWQGYRE